MKNSFAIGVFGVLVCALLTGCFRNETSELTINVPGMENERDARIVTNAALNEVVGSLGSLKHAYEFNVETHVVLYHESQRLVSPVYQHQLIASLNAVGLEAKIMNTGFNPLPVRRFPDGAVMNSWPDRFSTIISIPDMDTVTEANIVADAIAFVRDGGDDPRVTPNRDLRKLDVIYNNVALSKRNIENAIACVGYSANNIPPCREPQGWNYFTFATQ
jgi:hypothetical protein